MPSRLLSAKPGNKLAIIDEMTGEVVARGLDQAKAVIGTPKGGWEKDWLRLFQAKLAEIAALRLTGIEHSVLWVMLSYMDFNNYTHVSQSKIATLCGSSRPVISKAVKRLVEVGIVEIEESPGGVHLYKISDLWFWKGSDQNLKVSRANHLVNDRDDSSAEDKNPRGPARLRVV